MNVIKNLQILNSKERFLLLTQATGKDSLQLSNGFIKIINEKLKIEIPKDYFAAIDYHLDWLYASVHIDVQNDSNEHENSENVIKGTIEDIDLIIAFQEGDGFVVVLVEAKGVGSWTNKQVQSKLKRINSIFDQNARKIQPYFVLMSPKESSNLNLDKAEKWVNSTGKLNWIKLNVPEDLRKITLIKNKWQVEKR